MNLPRAEEVNPQGLKRRIPEAVSSIETEPVFPLAGHDDWFCAFNAVETFFTSYATVELGQTEGQFAMLLAFFSVSFVIFAVPSGFLAERIGRSRLIVLGQVIVFIPLLFVKDLWAVRGLLMLGGLFWACININSLPMVLELAGENEMGTLPGITIYSHSLPPSRAQSCLASSGICPEPSGRCLSIRQSLLLWHFWRYSRLPT